MRVCSFFDKNENNVLGFTFVNLVFVHLLVFIKRVIVAEVAEVADVAEVVEVAEVAEIAGIVRLGSNLFMSMVVDMYIGAFITYVFIEDGKDVVVNS